MIKPTPLITPMSSLETLFAKTKLNSSRVSSTRLSNIVTPRLSLGPKASILDELNRSRDSSVDSTEMCHKLPSQIKNIGLRYLQRPDKLREIVKRGKIGFNYRSTNQSASLEDSIQ